MNFTQDLVQFSRECIDAQKVYDYLLNDIQQCFNTTFTFTAIPEGTTRLELVECEIVPPTPLDPPTPICIELAPENRPNIPYCIYGRDITLQEVTLLKTVRIVATFNALNAAGTLLGQIQGVTPNLPFDCETVIMCAPEGTTVECTVTDSSRCTVGPLTITTGTDATATVTITLCQAIQSYALVKLEVLARFCRPRKNIKASLCRPNPIPPQCNSIFPGRYTDDDCGC